MLNDYRIRQALAYIDDETERDLTLNVLARVAAMSPFHFHRRFREATGMTVHGYVQRKRLERAAQKSKICIAPPRPVAGGDARIGAVAFSSRNRLDAVLPELSGEPKC